MDGPSLSGRERRTLARLEESLAEDEQLAELLRVFEDPIPQPDRRRRRVGIRAPDWTAISKWTAVGLSGAALGLLVAAVLGGDLIVASAAICVTVAALSVIGVFAYLRWWRRDGAGAARVPHRAHPTHVHGWTRAYHPRATDARDHRAIDPDDPGRER
ncbi:hypothetical protein OG948_43800 (plasmid) [Embleya sp. NBC_00888]|uniref:hypothetical protein n=1 Tax=Embleya sp. NBC_00888 TaxID=2975960 RepID=UPI002F9155B2|nr:hypothetical protein OG948_43800 [Embleya sp. NBC_00888]